MCGIVALATSEGSINDVGVVLESIQNVNHRGPDQNNVVSVGLKGPNIILGHTRLAIVGDTNALQPLVWASRDTLYHLAVNGEIYNWKELRNQLLDCGLSPIDNFKTDSDSEVLMACLVYRGLEWTLNNIRGMYAFVLVKSNACDGRIVSIILCRDLFGIKPLCFAVDHSRKRFFVSSEIAAIPDGFCAVELNDVLPSSYVTATFSTKTNSWLFKNTFYQNQLHHATIVTTKSLELAKLIHMKLVHAVSARIPSGGIGWGVLLSGGLDSSLIAGIAADAIYPLPLYAFTISFLNQKTSDMAKSDIVCARIVTSSRSNIVHEEVTFSFKEGLDALADVVNSVETTDAAVIRASVPLYLLSKHISARRFKVLLCGEGADEVFAGYRLFEKYDPNSIDDCESFNNELERRLFKIDTSELQRVDRCTSAHGLEARVPFLDVDFVKTVMAINYREKMSHPSLGKIQKYILRKAFDSYLPDSVIYREKEQFADGIGSLWVTMLQDHATRVFPCNNVKEDSETELYESLLHASETPERQLQFNQLIEARKARRRKDAYIGQVSRPGSFQPLRWHEVRHDEVLQEMNLTVEDAHQFLQNVLGWSMQQIESLSCDLVSLNKLIVSMLSRVPFHNLTLLTRERRPPTSAEIKNDMMTGLGGPCSVVNSFFAVLLDMLGFGPHVYLLSCRINGRDNCHVAILLQMKGLRYFIDVANAKPYNRAVQIGDSSFVSCLNETFHWNLKYSPDSGMIQLIHYKEKCGEGQVAVEFHPTTTVQYRSFRSMIQQSRSDASFGPFLIGLRICIFPNEATEILAVRDACIYHRDLNCKRQARCRDELVSIAESDAFGHIKEFGALVLEAVGVLDREQPGWFDASCEVLKSKGVVCHS